MQINNKYLHRYNAAGNIIGIADLRSYKMPLIEEDLDMRREMRMWGINNNVDSIMILEESSGCAAFMKVFEPQGNGVYGNFSTMCGNGIRAVAAYLNKGEKYIKIDTLSGLRKVEKVGENYEVNMGEATFANRDLKGYIKNFIGYDELYNIPNTEFPEKKVRHILEQMKINLETSTFSIGLSGSRNAGRIDGEPHLVIITDNTLNHEQIKDGLKRLAGYTVFNKMLFPQGINLNIIASSSNPSEKLNATFERNLGNNPEHAITAACGTGSTMAGAALIRRDALQRIDINNVGGVLGISKVGGEYFMLGPAKKI